MSSSCDQETLKHFRRAGHRAHSWRMPACYVWHKGPCKMIGSLALARLTTCMPVFSSNTPLDPRYLRRASSPMMMDCPHQGGPERAGMGLQELA